MRWSGCFVLTTAALLSAPALAQSGLATSQPAPANVQAATTTTATTQPATTATTATIPSPMGTDAATQATPPTDAQPAATSPATDGGNTAAAAAPPATIHGLATGTEIQLAPDEEWSSAKLAKGQSVAMHVTQDVLFGDRIVIPAGTAATGEVVQVERARSGGKPGELIVSARSIQLGERSIPLRSRLLAGDGVGKDRTGTSLGVSIALGIFGLAVHGSDLVIPANTPMKAKLAQDTPFD